MVELAHDAGALAWVDAVHYAPHGPIDVRAAGADVLVCSPYKYYGPHLGLAFGRRESAGWGGGSGGRGGSSRGSWRPGAASTAGPTLSLDVGDRVSHDKYGLGTVVATDGVGVRANVTVDFGSSGTVRLMLIGGVPLQKL